MTEFTADEIRQHRREWAEVLRSGQYEQAECAMKNTRGQMCCLGVLSVLAGCEFRLGRNDKFYTRNDGIGTADRKAMAFVGLRTDDGEFFEDGTKRDLATMNDSGRSFAIIADAIESEPEGLFNPL